MPCLLCRSGRLHKTNAHSIAVTSTCACVHGQECPQADVLTKALRPAQHRRAMNLLLHGKHKEPLRVRAAACRVAPKYMTSVPNTLLIKALSVFLTLLMYQRTACMPPSWPSSPAENDELPGGMSTSPTSAHETVRAALILLEASNDDSNPRCIQLPDANIGDGDTFWYKDPSEDFLAPHSPIRPGDLNVAIPDDSTNDHGPTRWSAELIHPLPAREGVRAGFSTLGAGGALEPPEPTEHLEDTAPRDADDSHPNGRPPNSVALAVACPTRDRGDLVCGRDSVSPTPRASVFY